MSSPKLCPNDASLAEPLPLLAEDDPLEDYTGQDSITRRLRSISGDEARRENLQWRMMNMEKAGSERSEF